MMHSHRRLAAVIYPKKNRSVNGARRIANA